LHLLRVVHFHIFVVALIFFKMFHDCLYIYYGTYLTRLLSAGSYQSAPEGRPEEEFGN